MVPVYQAQVVNGDRLMKLYRNGFVVAEITNMENFTYKAWPLFDLIDDKMALAMTDEAYNSWFQKYEMQHIVPDPDYIKRYFTHCNNIGLKVKVLLFESLYKVFEVENSFVIDEILGFDCIGTVYESYLRTEFESFKGELELHNIRLNKNGLFHTLEDAVYFSKLRQQAIASGENIENFWEEMPVRISIVSLL